MTKEFWKATLIRAIRTVCQTAIATIGTAVVLTDVNWKYVVSASILAGILSVLTSISTGLPEVELLKTEELTDQEACEWLEEDEEAADEVIELMEEESEENDG